MGGKPDVTLTKTTIFNKLYDVLNINLQAFNKDRAAFTMAKEITVLIVAAVLATAVLIALILTESYVTLPVWAAVKGLFA